MATNQQNINIGTADNANDGDTLRAAFRKVRKMFAEIYGDTDAENLADIGLVPATSFDTHITEKIQDTVSGMFSSGDQTNITVTYDDNDGSIDLNVAADITDVNAGAGLTGTNEAGGAATLAVGAGNGITVNDDDVALASSVAGAGLSYDSGVLSVDAIGTDGIASDAVTAAKIALFDDNLAATDTYVLVADGIDFNSVPLSGDATISNAGALTIANDAVTHDKLENRFTEVASITTLAGTVSFDCSTASVFKLSGDLTGAYTIDLTGYKKGQVISIFPLKAQTVNLAAQGTSTNTFNKLAEADYDNTVTSLLQIECVDDSATDPVFFYSVATFASDSSI